MKLLNFAIAICLLAMVLLPFHPAIASGAPVDEEGQNKSSPDDANARVETTRSEDWTTTLRISPKEPSLSGKVVFEAEVVANNSLHLDAPELIDFDGSFRVLREEVPHFPSRLSGGQGKETIPIRFRYILSPLSSGEVQLPQLAIPYSKLEGSNTEYGVIKTTECKIQIKNNFGSEKGELSSLAPVVPPQSMPDTAAWGWIFATSLGATAIALLIAWFALRPSRHRILQQSPETIAEKSLLTLKSANLPNTGKAKEFFVQITGIVRNYLEQKTGMHAPDQTTEEFMAQVRQERIVPGEVADKLSEFLSSADQIKYAGVIPDQSIVDRSLQQAHELIRPELWSAFQPNGPANQSVAKSRKGI